MPQRALLIQENRQGPFYVAVKDNRKLKSAGALCYNLDNWNQSEERTMAERNTAEIGFEKQIWDAACVLRYV